MRTGIWMGLVMIGLAAGMLVLDQLLAPWYPFLFLTVVLLALAACYELHHLLGPSGPPLWLCVTAVLAVLLANWPAHLWTDLCGADPWRLILAAFTGAVLAAFLAEMATFRAPGGSVVRIALTV